MAYVTRTDIETSIGTAHLEQIEDGDTSLVDFFSLTAESDIQTYISDMYDLDTEFALTGTNRNQSLLRIAINLVAYYLYQRVVSDQIPEIRIIAYDNSMKILRDMQKGNNYLQGVGRNEPNAGRSIRFGAEEDPTFSKDIY